MKERILKQFIENFLEVINDLKQQKQSKSKELLFKSEYMYISNKQIFKFIRMEENSDRKNELRLLRDSFSKFKTNKDKYLTVYDLGTGDGKKGEEVVSLLKENEIDIEYVGVDFSSRILNLAVEHIIMHHPDLKTTKIKANIFLIKPDDARLNIITDRISHS